MELLVKYLLVGIAYRAYLEYKPLVNLLGFGRTPDRNLLEDTIFLPGFFLALLGFDSRLLVIGVAVGSGLLFVDFSIKRLIRDLLVFGVLWLGFQSQFQPLILGPFLGLGYAWCQRRFSRQPESPHKGQFTTGI